MAAGGALATPRGARFNNLGGACNASSGSWGESELAFAPRAAARRRFADGWYNLSVTLIKQRRINEGMLAHSKGGCAVA
jgi:hypothetical protein